MSCPYPHLCHCGTANKPGVHLTGHCGCKRFMVETPGPVKVEPCDTFWQEWLVDGHQITDFTLKYQRGYFQHDCGCWSRWPGSDNSIDS